MNNKLWKAIPLTMVAILLCSFLSNAQDWLTPFEKSDGLATPRYDTTIAFFKRLDKASPIITTEVFGDPTPEGRSLYIVIADKDGLNTPGEIRKAGRLIVLVQACIHPGESEGKDAGMLLMRDMGIHGEHLDLLDSCSLVFIPIYNADGHERFGPYNRINQNGPIEMGWRTTALNLNLNRDYLKLDAPETHSWLKLWNTWDFDFFVDIHTTDGADYKYVITYQMETHGNMEKDLSDWCSKEFIPAFEKGLTEAGVPVFPYITFRRWTDPMSGMAVWVSPPRLSQGYAAVCNRPGILIETHMLKDYRTRVEGSYQSLVEIMSILGQQKSILKKLEEDADQYVSSPEFRKTPYPLRFQASDTSQTIVLEGFEFEQVESPITGGTYYRYTENPKQIELDYFNDVEVVKSVSLPDYYIIPPQYWEVVKRLNAHGIDYELTGEGDTLAVVMSKLKDPKWSSSPYEGRFTVQVAEDTFRVQRYFPKGSYLIPMNQPKAGVIAHILEPSAPDSYVYWGFFNSIFEQKEYGEDYVLEPMAKKMLDEDPTLKAEYDELMKDPKFASSQRGILNWFYMHSPYWDGEKDLYPVGRIYNPSTLNRIK